MTQLIGRPDVPANTPLKATVTYTGAYQRGDALGVGTVTYTWDWTDNRWERTDGTVNSLIAARWEQNDPAPPQLQILFRIGTGDGTLGRPVKVLAAETAAGVLDVTHPLESAPYITGPALSVLIASTDTARTAAQSAATAADTAATTANAAVANLNATINTAATTAATAATTAATASLTTATNNASTAAAQANTAAARADTAAALTGYDLPRLLRMWTQGEDYETTSITRNSDGLVTGATVLWPDGSAGTLTTTNYNTTYGVYDGFTITHTASGKTVTQVAVTRDSNGAVTAKPALVVS